MIYRRGSPDPKAPPNQRNALPPIKERHDSTIEHFDDTKKSNFFNSQSSIKTQPFDKSIKLLLDSNGGLRAFSTIVESQRKSEQELKKTPSESSRLDYVRGYGEKYSMSNKNLLTKPYQPRDSYSSDYRSSRNSPNKGKKVDNRILIYQVNS